MKREEKLEFLKIAEKDIVAKSKTYHIKGMDSEDVAQELRFSVWKESGRYDEKKAGKRTFIQVVIKSKLKKLARDSKRKKQYLNNAVSLEYSDEENIMSIEDPNWQKTFIGFISTPNDKIWGK